MDDMIVARLPNQINISKLGAQRIAMCLPKLVTAAATSEAIWVLQHIREGSTSDWNSTYYPDYKYSVPLLNGHISKDVTLSGIQNGKDGKVADQSEDFSKAHAGLTTPRPWALAGAFWETSPETMGFYHEIVGFSSVFL